MVIKRILLPEYFNYTFFQINSTFFRYKYFINYTINLLDCPRIKMAHLYFVWYKVKKWCLIPNFLYLNWIIGVRA